MDTSLVKIDTSQDEGSYVFSEAELAEMSYSEQQLLEQVLYLLIKGYPMFQFQTYWDIDHRQFKIRWERKTPANKTYGPPSKKRKADNYRIRVR